MSDTPETDAEEGRYRHAAVINMCSLDFARKLERERDEARFDLAFRRELYALQELQLSEARKTILELQKK